MKNSPQNSFRLFCCCGLLFFIFLAAISSCKKDGFISSTNALINISVDSLKYDTVFTQTGSITQIFKISNPNNENLLLSTVKLMGGAGSAFSINVNGVASNQVNNITIAANDSIYVFVTVKINPNTTNLPFIVKDSIFILFNGNNRFVQLEAYGKNAHFLYNKPITGNTVWTNDLPYVLLGSLQIDSTASLIIAAGCTIYVHANSPIIVNGRLTANGTHSNPVVFTGDRLDMAYKNLPASWPGVYFTKSSTDNVLSFAHIKNATQAVVAEQPTSNGNPKLTLHQCIIDNASDVGLLAVNSSIIADNCLISNCGTNLSLTFGGNYQFTNCTVVAYSTNFISHKMPVLEINNLAIANASSSTSLNAVLRNCIFWGDTGFVNNQILVNKQASNAFHVIFEHCLYNSTDTPANSTISGSVKNLDPLFNNIDLLNQLFNFHTTGPGAPGVNMGVDNTGFNRDLDNNNRSVGITDIGCYEKQ